MRLGDFLTEGNAGQIVAAMRRHVRFIIVCVLVGAGAGTAAAYLLPSEWKSDAELQPEAPDQSELGAAGLAGLASQLAGGGSLGTNAQFFADLITSRAVTRRLAQASFPSKKGIRPLAEIYGYGDLPREERIQRTTTKLASAISSDMNFRTSVVSFSVKGNTPEMAKSLADSILAIVNDFNVQIRQRHAHEQREYADERVADAERTLKRVDDQLLDWQLHNRETTSPELRQQFLEIQRQQSIALALYEQVRANQEQAKLQEVRNTPAIMVLEEPLLPTKRAWPRRGLLMVASTLAGLAVALIYVLLTTVPGVTPPANWSYPAGAASAAAVSESH